MTEYRYAGREYLSGKGRRGMKMIDMEYVYRQIDFGRTVKEIAEVRWYNKVVTPNRK